MWLCVCCCCLFVSPTRGKCSSTHTRYVAEKRRSPRSGGPRQATSVRESNHQLLRRRQSDYRLELGVSPQPLLGELQFCSGQRRSLPETPTGVQAESSRPEDSRALYLRFAHSGRARAHGRSLGNLPGCLVGANSALSLSALVCSVSTRICYRQRAPTWNVVWWSR